jgi:uncharacterized protein (TIGR02265 family)
MEEHKVKGTMLMDFVRMIRANKNLDWDKHLQPGDWDIINGILLPSKWYPIGFYRRCSMAAFSLLANSDLEAARANGRSMAKRLFDNTYKSMTQSRDPMRALKQFVATYASFFNFSGLKLEQVEPHHAKVHHDYSSVDKGNIPYCHQLQGMFETLVSMSGGKNHKVSITAKQWEGAPATVFDITWQ